MHVPVAQHNLYFKIPFNLKFYSPLQVLFKEKITRETFGLVI